ncbi:MAG: ribonuclease HII [Pseudomonadota bacterium]
MHCGGRRGVRARRWAIGVDEVGRGPLAGPVVAAAVVLHPRRVPEGLKDSKKLTARQRERLAGEIREQATAWCIASAEVEEIDRLNILQASLLAMTRALAGVVSDGPADRALIDGRQLPTLPEGVARAEAVIGGDATVASISAASILAKVWRDEHMVQAHARFPAYGFEKHKGYPTRSHLEALRDAGPCALHRRSFAPVDAALRERTEGVA